MNKLKACLKSKTFWGGLGFALFQYVETLNVLPPGVAKLGEGLFAALGFYGARNAKVKT